MAHKVQAADKSKWRVEVNCCLGECSFYVRMVDMVLTLCGLDPNSKESV